MTNEQIEQLANKAVERQDFETARRLLIPLADRGSIFALLTLGWMYQHGSDPLQDKSLARECYHKAIATGSVEGYLHLGWLLGNDGKFAQARAMFNQGKEEGGSGFDDALAKLSRIEAEMSAHVAMENNDFRQAFLSLSPYEAHDSEYTLMNLGWLYHTGAGGVTNENLAYACFTRAAAMGSAKANYLIGLFEIQKGEEEAAQATFLNGSIMEHLPSMSKLGEMMIDGRGGPIDIKKGIQYLTRAAEQGHLASKLKLVRTKVQTAGSMFRKITSSFGYFVLIGDSLYQLSKGELSETLYDFWGFGELDSKHRAMEMLRPKIRP
jgi:TPR repeat protein